MKAASVLMILLFSFAVCKGQTGSINKPNDSVSFSIQLKDRYNKEVGFFKYNQFTNRLIIRGNLKETWKSFAPFLESMWNVYEAQQGIFEYLNVDGTIRDTDGFNEAMRNYLLIKRKYGM